MAKYGLKYSMKVSKWPFRSLGSKLLISMHSEAETNGNFNNNCGGVENSDQVVTGVDGSDNLRYIKLSLNGATLYLFIHDFIFLLLLYIIF